MKFNTIPLYHLWVFLLINLNLFQWIIGYVFNYLNYEYYLKTLKKFFFLIEVMKNKEITQKLFHALENNLIISVTDPDAYKVTGISDIDFKFFSKQFNKKWS